MPPPSARPRRTRPLATEPAPILRAATPDDAPAIAAIWEAGWRDGHLGNVPDELVEFRDAESFRSRVPDRIAETTVADVGGEVAGFVTLSGDEVEQVFVDARHRGSGVAVALMADAERRLRDAGHRRAWLAVVPGNARARRFYERLGWTDAGRFDYDADTRAGPIRVPAHRYVKEL